MTKGVAAVVTQRLQTAGTRAIESQTRLREMAEALSQELEEVTVPEGAPVRSLDDHDSMVIEIERALAAGRR